MSNTVRWRRAPLWRNPLMLVALSLFYALMIGNPGVVPRVAHAQAGSPSDPGAGYVLDWESASDRTTPSSAPPGWAAEYAPTLRHADGEPQVRPAQAPNEPVRGGQWSSRFELDRGDPTINNGARAELSAPFEPLGAERWYGFSIYLPATWAPDRSAESVIQWHQHWDLCCSPPLAILTRNGQWEISQNWEGPTNQDTPIGPYQTGRWTDWVVHVKWSADSDGVLEIWKDGQPVPGFAHKPGKNTYTSSVGNYLKIGIYKWDWSQGKPSDTTRRVMYFDELRIADQRGSYDAVAPQRPTPPATVTLVGGLTMSPAIPMAGQQVTATYTVQNTGGQSISVPYFLVGARDPSGANVDFPASSPVTLRPGQEYTYSATRTLPSAGSYSAWPAYYDGTNWVELAPTHASFTVKAPSPGKLSLVAPVALAPATLAVGQPVTASFTVQNTGGQPISVQYFLVGARDPSNANVDFPASPPVTLQPGQQYIYQQPRTFATAGTYTAWPAYYDGTDWVELAPHASFSVQPGAAACSPTLPQLGPGTFPSACWRPYADASPFNTPLPGQLAPGQLAPNSAATIQHVLNTAATKQPSNFVANVDGTSGWPTYYSHFSQDTDPAYRVHCTAPWGVCPLEGTVVHLPQGAVVQGGQAAAPPGFTPDAHLTVVDVDSGWEYDFWQVQRSPIRSSDGAQLNISWGGRTRIDGDGLTTEGNATAAHFGNLAGRIRAEELLAGSINHALFIVIDCDNGQFVYPAKASDKRCSSDIANAPPMGSRLQLAMSPAEIDALPVPEWKKVLLRAMATYGMFFGDTGSSFSFSFQTEAGAQYTVSGRPDQWLAVAKKYGWAYHDGSDPSYPFANYTGSMRNDDDGIDWTQRVWSRLRVVAPCVSDGTCR